MTTIGNIDKYLSSIAPTELREIWDNDGVMLCKSTDAEVKKAVVCLEVNIEVIKKAAEIGAQLIVSHHPFIFKPLKNVTGESFAEIELLVKNGISVLSYHTRFDKASDGVNDILAEKLGLCDITVGDDGFLRIGRLASEMTAEEFADYLRERLDCGIMKAYFEGNAIIRTVALCGGAGKDFLFNAVSKADAFVSADLSHNTFIDAKNLGIAVFDAGHYHTENPAVARLTDILKAQFPDVDFTFCDVGCPFFTV